MSQQIICTHCQFANPHGSKFCSNCGEKLPLSTHILCPNCHTSNQIDRIFCDNCGTRLVQDTPLVEDEPEEDEETQSGPQAFSLPSRRPGETGELGPNLLPEWLRTGEPNTIEEDEKRAEEEANETVEAPKITTDELTKIEDLKSESSMEDDLPDWLLDQIDSDPIIPQSAGITTELYLDLVNNPELPDIEDEVTRINDEPGEGANLPDWLQDANSALSPQDEGDEETEEEQEEQFDSDLDILAGLTDILAQQTDELIPPSESGIGLTDWLSDAEAPDTSTQEDDLNENTGITDWLTEPYEEGAADTAEPKGSGLTDILNDADPFVDSDFGSEPDANDGVDELLSESQPGSDALGEAPNDGAGLTDWLTNLDELESPEEGQEDWLGELAGEDEAGVDDWLSGLNQLTESQMNLESTEEETEETSPSEEIDDWLADLADASPGTSPIDDDNLSVTDWLTAPDEPDPLAAQPSAEQEPAVDDTAVDDFFNEIFDDVPETEPQDEPPPLQPDEEVLPGWLLSEDEGGVEEEDETIHSELDWMFETGGVDFEESGETAVSPPDAVTPPEASPEDGTDPDEGFDWLDDIQDINTGKLIVPDADDEEETESEDVAESESEAIITPVEPELEAPQAEEDAWDDNPLDEPQLPEELPDWMQELGPPVEQASSDPALVESDPEIESELPEWLTQLRPGEEGLIGSSLPSALNPDLVNDPLNMPDIPMELNKADLPDWLSDESGDLPAALDEPNEANLGWLGESEIDGRPAPTEWDSSLRDKLPPPKPEPKLVEVEIPDWLERFKPEELKGSETDVVPPQITPAPTDDSQESGLARLRGIIQIEQSIMPIAPAKAPHSLTITPTQTRQIELMRHLLDVEEAVQSPVDAEPSANLPNFWNLLIAFLLFITAAVFWISPGLFPLQLDPPSLASDEGFALLEGVEGQTVLVAFEHTPGMSGELNYQAESILALLAEGNNRIIPVTQHATTVGLMSEYEEIDSEQIIFLPGEAVGLRLLGDCIQGDVSACQSIPALGNTAEIADIELIVLITSERETLINWIEQVSTISEKPIVVSATTALAPLAQPYTLTGQLDGVMTHASYVAQPIPGGEPRTRLTQQANSAASIQLVAIVLLLGSLVLYGLRRPSNDQGGNISS